MTTPEVGSHAEAVPSLENVAPTLQFFKSGYMLTQFRGGDEIRLRSELTRLLAALRL